MSKSGYYKKQVKQQPYPSTFVFEQLKSTKALLKFCRDHNRDTGEYIELIQKCANALERKDIEAAVTFYQKVPLGGNGCFNDWYPQVVFEHETGEYTWAVFEALTYNWSRLMGLSVGK